MASTGFLYVHINKTNGLKYVGITTQASPERRWKNGAAYAKNEKFNQDIKRYGWDGFHHYVLFKDVEKDILQHLEYRLIGYFQTKEEDYGYNQKKGTSSELDASIRQAEDLFIELFYNGYQYPGLFSHNQRISFLSEQVKNAPSAIEFEDMANKMKENDRKTYLTDALNRGLHTALKEKQERIEELENHHESLTLQVNHLESTSKTSRFTLAHIYGAAFAGSALGAILAMLLS